MITYFPLSSTAFVSHSHYHIHLKYLQVNGGITCSYAVRKGFKVKKLKLFVCQFSQGIGGFRIYHSVTEGK